jgi:beta-RFAP synthase
MSTRHITLLAPARLHLGFLDMDGTLGRRFGSIGLGINEIYTRIEVSPATDWAAEGACSEKALKLARQFADRLNIPFRCRIQLHETIPEHAGLGSGTQLALAIGLALVKLAGLTLSIREIAHLMGRGARSGIGIAVFERGGLIVDGGRGTLTTVPPLLCRLEIPADWRFILVLDEQAQGLSGSPEVSAFQTLPPFPEKLAAHLCHLVLLRALPAVAEADLPAFGAAISEIQAWIGDHFAQAQGGRHTSSRVARLLEYLKGQGATGMGQSSWGPTGFCLVATPEEAEALVRKARDHYRGQESLPGLLIATPRNRGTDGIRPDEEITE